MDSRALRLCHQNNNPTVAFLCQQSFHRNRLPYLHRRQSVIPSSGRSLTPPRTNSNHNYFNHFITNVEFFMRLNKKKQFPFSRIECFSVSLCFTPSPESLNIHYIRKRVYDMVYKDFYFPNSSTF